MLVRLAARGWRGGLGPLRATTSTTSTTSRATTSTRASIRGMKAQAKPQQSIDFQTSGMRMNTETKGFLKWCTTEEGRIVVGRRAICIGGLIIGGLSYCANIFMVDLVRDAYNSNAGEKRQSVLERLDKDTQYQVGVLSDLFQRLFYGCQARAGVEDTELQNIDIFYTNSLDPVSQGWASTRQGAVVGIPKYMVDDQGDLTSLRVRPTYNYFHKGYRLPSDLCEEAKEDLRKTMVLSPEEKEFVVSREVAKVAGWGALRETFFYPLAFVTQYMLGRQVNTVFKMFDRPRALRVAVQALVGVAGLLSLYMVKNYHSLETEEEAIVAVCTTAPQLEVAAGYYQKLLNRNKVLREVLGREGDGGYCFTEEGEVQPLFYEAPFLTSLRLRRDFCRAKIHDMDL